MEPVKYYYEFDGNRDKQEDEQGYALITLMSAKDQNQITNKLINQTMGSGKKRIEIDHGAETLKVNRKNCPKAFNVVDPITGDKHAEIPIEDLYLQPQFKELYEELSNVVGDFNMLKDGIKKK